MKSREELFEDGLLLMRSWCEANGVVPPHVLQNENPVRLGVCAYYRSGVTTIHVPSCAVIGVSGRQWSFPGYIVDRTPYGVLQHELGHHVEGAHGSRGGIVASLWRERTGEQPITTYCPNDNEWFAEIFRLFVTNPNLLEQIRPKVFSLLLDRWPHVVERRPWQSVLDGGERQKNAARNKIEESARRARRGESQSALF